MTSPSPLMPDNVPYNSSADESGELVRAAGAYRAPLRPRLPIDPLPQSQKDQMRWKRTHLLSVCYFILTMHLVAD
jgi:hypothetical protein